MNETETMNVRPVSFIRANKDSKAHIAKVIIEECGTHNIPFVLNARTVLLYNPNLTPEELLASIDVLRRDVKLRIQKSPEVQKEKEAPTP
jgi:hypothetical protein